IVHTLLKFAIALELGYRTFHSFPAAHATGRRAVLLAFALMSAFVLDIQTGGRAADAQLEWHARVLNGTIWLIGALALVILWYRLPVHPLHKAILTGFVPYLLVFSLVQRVFADRGEDVRCLHNSHTAAYALLLAYWNRQAWLPRRTRAPGRR